MPNGKTCGTLPPAAIFFSAQPAQTQRYTLLGARDTFERNLRHLAAHVYEERTGDRAGAANMRAMVALGSGSDIAPDWLIGEVTQYSTAAYSRSECVAPELKRRKGKCDSKAAPQDGQGGGRGKGKGQNGQ